MYNITGLNDGKLTTLLEELRDELRKVYGNHLKNIILYGSYARGDYDSESDLDIMVLVDLDNVDQGEYRDVLADKVTAISIKYDVLISVIDNNYEEFNRRTSYVPFYKNVMQEGIEIYGNQ